MDRQLEKLIYNLIGQIQVGDYNLIYLLLKNPTHFNVIVRLLNIYFPEHGIKVKEVGRDYMNVSYYRKKLKLQIIYKSDDLRYLSNEKDCIIEF